MNARIEAGDVFLLTGGDQEASAVPDLRLSLDDGGITLTRANGGAVWETGWDTVTELSVPGYAELPGGAPGIELLVALGRGSAHRFVLPTDEPAVLEERLIALARDHGLAQGAAGHRTPWLLVLAVLVATAAVVAVLLLAAAHVLDF